MKQQSRNARRYDAKSFKLCFDATLRGTLVDDFRESHSIKGLDTFDSHIIEIKNSCGVKIIEGIYHDVTSSQL